MCEIKKNIFIMYKMVIITKKTLAADKNDTKWLNEKHIKGELGHVNLPVVARKYPSKYRKQRQELANCSNFQPCGKCF